MPDDNPILNNPYEEPAQHYATNLSGELDYSRPEPGRRIFTPEMQSVPVRQGDQRDMLEINEIAAASYGTHLVNLLRREIRVWREAGYPQTTRITRELLGFWFLNEERDFTQRLFYAQREAIETAIYLNEVAEKSNVGQHMLRELETAQLVSNAAENNLPRIAFKMATGTGKTVVMAAFIAYHYFNRAEYRNDTRFADNFLVVTPGITIRDRLAVLRVDVRRTEESSDYYHVRYLAPKSWRKDLEQLNSKLVITNYHAFEPKTLQGNKRSPLDGKIGADGRKQEAREDYGQVIHRVLGHFRPGSRLLILNDEAHHCYLPKEDDRQAEGEDVEEENKRAAVWFNGLVQIAARFKLRRVYDLSATPYYLTGSGYEPYSLFPWVVTDFGLIEAIESGLVKIPFLPTRDDTQEISIPVLRNLYEHVKADLPKAGQKTERSRAREKGEKIREEPPRLPPTLKTALKQFYEHYEEEFRERRHSLGAAGVAQLGLEDSPPVFIVVCNNTSVSKEVFKYIAGYEVPNGDAAHPAQAVTGAYELLSNYDPGTLKPKSKPPTLLIDSDALENSGQVDDEFRRVFAPEIGVFKRDYARVHGQGAAEQITDAEILREVVNTVGKRNTLGAHIRCVVSVSMLTEGWDANTVTHICGIRKFGSQLLCEQVAGRALRRRSYFLSPYDPKTGEPLPQDTTRKRDVIWKFPPEYAHIIGVPFKMFKGGRTVPPPPVDAKRIMALPERAAEHEIRFPNVDGYRIEYPDGELTCDFSTLDDYQINGAKLPTKTIMATAVSGEEVELNVDGILATREQEIIYRITKDLLRDHFTDDAGNLEFHRFLQLRGIVERWYHEKVRVLGKDAQWKKLLYYYETKKLVAHAARAIQAGKPGESVIRPILNYYNPQGSSQFVRGQTTRDIYPTRHSHVNYVVIDSGWEGRAAKTLDDLVEEKHVLAWVKNAFLDFRIPYMDKEGQERDYLPDFIARCKTPADDTVNLIIEVTGMKKDKPEKTWYAHHRWLPAVNRVRRQQHWPSWDFLEVDDETKLSDLRNLILLKLETFSAKSSVWAQRRFVEKRDGAFTEEIELPERVVDMERWDKSPLD